MVRGEAILILATLLTAEAGVGLRYEKVPQSLLPHTHAEIPGPTAPNVTSPISASGAVTHDRTHRADLVVEVTADVTHEADLVVG